MVPESELIGRLREFLRSSDLNSTTTAAVRRKLEKDFEIDLSDSKAFIREQVDLFLLNENEQAEEPEKDKKDHESEESQGSNSKKEMEDDEEEQEQEEKLKLARNGKNKGRNTLPVGRGYLFPDFDTRFIWHSQLLSDKLRT